MRCHAIQTSISSKRLTMTTASIAMPKTPKTIPPRLCCSFFGAPWGLRRRQAPAVTTMAASSDVGAAGEASSGRGRRGKQATTSSSAEAMGVGGSAKKRSSSTSTSSSSKKSSSSSSSSSSSKGTATANNDNNDDSSPRTFAQLSEPELQGLPLLERLALSAGGEENESESELFSAPAWAGRRGGYTPFELVDFTDEDVLHEVQITVEKPRAHVYEVWADRLNYGEWFSLLGQAVLHADSPELASYFVFYRWGQLPPLELYATLSRDLEENESVLERSVDGWDLAVGAFFEDSGGNDGGEDGTTANSTVVTLRLGYALPAPLAEHVGSVGIYGHVEEILRADMKAMKRFVESGGGSDLGALRERRKEEEAALAAQVQEERSKGADSVLVAASQAESQGLYDEEMAEYGDEAMEGAAAETSFGEARSRGGGGTGGGGSRRSKTAAVS